jgi:hypothetical protein
MVALALQNSTYHGIADIYNGNSNLTDFYLARRIISGSMSLLKYTKLKRIISPTRCMTSRSSAYPTLQEG